ncbi:MULTISPECIES: GNAT family N-acetyltransferase [Vagococcus]|uniref:Acetyltransferase, GNAT family n=1 Tax=Vagococcus fluvialis bH819 TaxID=1255619 RepID=A0A1X6WNW0_9ENTE|nr:MULTISPECIES: GNAT family N-acetyltransferase [Vagococcus]SLM85975.1 acetyltransferase, GNAT family [Vagococcus fluvialis bH819]HCM88342.1 N-acetyltransferase [Vagococcus sp.]
MIISLSQANMTLVTNTWNSGFSDYVVPINMSEKQLNNRVNSLNLSRDLSCVYKQDDDYLGVMLLGIQQLNKQKIMWVGGISVIPQARGQMIATKMMKHAEDLAHKNECDEIRLEVISTNHKAKKLYESLSYQVLNELSIAELNYLPTKKINDITLFNFPHQNILINEPNLIPWQNRLVFTKNCYLIGDTDSIIGYLSFSETASSLSIQQLVIFDEQKLQLIEDILIYLANSYKRKITINNFDMSSKEYKMIHSLGLETNLSQYQLTLSFVK